MNGSKDEVVSAQLTDRELLSQFREVEKFDQQDKHMIKTFIDAFLTKRKIQQLASYSKKPRNFRGFYFFMLSLNIFSQYFQPFLRRQFKDNGLLLPSNPEQLQLEFVCKYLYAGLFFYELF